MNVSSSSWHAKLFRFHQKMKYGYETGVTYTNLCPYMRTVLFYWWLRWLFLSGRISFKGYSLRVPIFVWAVVAGYAPGTAGMFSYHLKVVLHAFEAAIAFGTLVIGLFMFANRNGAMDDAANVAVDKIDDGFEKVSGFVALLLGYLRTFHTAICPSIKIVDGGK